MPHWTRVLIVVTGLLLVAPLDQANAQDWHRGFIDAGDEPCDGMMRDVNGWWANTTGRTIVIREIRYWQSSYQTLTGDILGSLWLSKGDDDVTLLDSVAFDRYNVNSNSRDEVTPPGLQITMPPGSWLTWKRSCAPLAWSPWGLHRQTVKFWYTLEAKR